MTQQHVCSHAGNIRNNRKEGSTDCALQRGIIPDTLDPHQSSSTRSESHLERAVGEYSGDIGKIDILDQLTQQSALDDPGPFYAWLRRTAPVHLTHTQHLDTMFGAPYIA